MTNISLKLKRGNTFLYIVSLTFLLAMLVWDPASAESIAVIVNAKNPVDSLSVKKVRRYYQNDELSWPQGGKIKLYDLKVTDPVRKQFSKSVLGKSADKVANGWARAKINNTAKNPPKVAKSAILVLERVAKDINAIGYIPSSAVTNSVKKVLEIK